MTYNQPLLQAVNLTFDYSRRDTTKIVQDWTASFYPGQVTTITGPSGCGKSTRMYLLALMLRATSGEILLESQPVSKLYDHEKSALRAKHFGFVFQDAALDTTRTVLDNITETALYAGRDRKEAKHNARDLMEKFNVTVPAHRLPGQISGGQAQRIALCRALSGKPPIIFADEPTGNLDPHSANIILEAFRDAADRGSTVIVVTHDMNIAAWSDTNIAIELPHRSVQEVAVS